jgi:cyclopropane fatty-acyl-phospholipid synthase-like methyltransferase
MERKYRMIVSHYEECLERHGDTHLGVDWPKKEDAATRYQVMLDVIRPNLNQEKVQLLDFGCGASHLFEFIRAQKIANINYSGLDLSERFITLSRTKFPENDYYCVDLLENAPALPQFDYIIMNGVFTEKRDLSFDEMLSYFKKLLETAWSKAMHGLAFNVMSKHVDWERGDLFHLPFDILIDFVGKQLSPKFVVRNDYGLYEYTTYIYR